MHAYHRGTVPLHRRAVIDVGVLLGFRSTRSARRSGPQENADAADAADKPVRRSARGSYTLASSFAAIQSGSRWTLQEYFVSVASRPPALLAGVMPWLPVGCLTVLPSGFDRAVSSSVRPCVRSPVLRSVYTSVPPSVRLSVLPYVRPSVCSYVRLHMRSPVFSSTNRSTPNED